MLRGESQIMGPDRSIGVRRLLLLLVEHGRSLMLQVVLIGPRRARRLRLLLLSARLGPLQTIGRRLGARLHLSLLLLQAGLRFLQLLLPPRPGRALLIASRLRLLL